MRGALDLTDMDYFHRPPITAYGGASPQGEASRCALSFAIKYVKKGFTCYAFFVNKINEKQVMPFSSPT